jgi:HU domain-containing protein
MIEYQVIPNPLTTPPSFSLRVQPSGTFTDDELYAEVGSEVSLDTATVHSVLDGLRRVTTRRLLAGDTVQIPGIASLVAQVAEKLDTATQPLSGNATKGVNLRADIEQINAIKTNGQFSRIESSSQAPKLVTVTGLGGADLGALRPGNLVQVEGERLGIDPAQPDEGAFLVPGAGPAFRMTDYNAVGPKTTQFFIAAGLPADADLLLEIRNRRSPGGPLYTTRWPNPLHTAADSTPQAVRAKAPKAKAAPATKRKTGTSHG